ncbi:hypothetical protein Sjap_023798 [Stephania japonica]|uniref:Uncharacterized protein n=1 Tax=Stephania japonica TaxID=461633 RepID=A0AAP0EC96_9MAGN
MSMLLETPTVWKVKVTLNVSHDRVNENQELSVLHLLQLDEDALKVSLDCLEVLYDLVMGADHHYEP